MKRCSLCRISKSLSDFYPDARLSYGVGGWCKDCKNLKQREAAAKIRDRVKPVVQTKTCSSCQTTKPGTEFARCPSKNDGLSSRCKECRRAFEAKTRMDPMRQTKQRLKNYGMSVDDFTEMVAQHSERCAICTTKLRRCYIDHDHQTGVVRGLLCCRCNTWLAAIEDADFVARAQAYLSRHRLHPPTKPFRVNRRWHEQLAAGRAKRAAERAA